MSSPAPPPVEPAARPSGAHGDPDPARQAKSITPDLTQNIGQTRRRRLLAQAQMENVVCRGIQVLIAPDSGLRKSARPGWDGGLYAFMRRVLSTDQAKALYRKRQATVEPVFGQIKFNRRLDRFLGRGRSAVRSEWRLAGATHNLLKLHNHRTAAAAT